MSNYNFNLSDPKQLINFLGYSDLKSFILVLDAYNNLSNGNKQEVIDLGYNQHTGCVWLALESGISICSSFGQSVLYGIIHENGEECEFSTICEVLDFLQFGKISE